jgi:hypothetical protein
VQPSTHEVIHDVIAAGNVAEHLPNKRLLLLAGYCLEACTVVKHAGDKVNRCTGVAKQNFKMLAVQL